VLEALSLIPTATKKEKKKKTVRFSIVFVEHLSCWNLARTLVSSWTVTPGGEWLLEIGPALTLSVSATPKDQPFTVFGGFHNWL
jgi:hypothetical protein